MNDIIYKGLKISTPRRYFYIHQGTSNLPQMIDDSARDTLEIIYPEGSTTKSLAESLGLSCTDVTELDAGMRKADKTERPTITLNGLTLKKLTYDPHIINVVIVSDSESRVAQDYGYTTIVVSKDDYKDQKFINYLFFSSNLAYLTPVGVKPECYELRNFPKINLNSKSLTLTSTSETVFSLRRRYNDYLIREIDYQDQFILEIRRILEDYGLELVRINKEQTLTKTSYVTYQISQTPVKSLHPGMRYPESKIISYRQPVDFTLHTTDMVMYHDFKNKYTNLDLLTNFCEFKTTDRYGDRWTAAIKWSSVTEDFNHVYQPDDNANFAYQCQFRCELSYYEVFDDRYKFLTEIVTRLDDKI